MKLTFGDIRKHCPALDEQLAEEHLDRLGDGYFSTFGPETVARHIELLSTLSRESPVALMVSERSAGSVSCTVLGFDYPAEFSFITGILSSMGFTILSGNVFTYRPGSSVRGRKQRKPGGSRAQENLIGRRRIIDHFSGQIERDVNLKEWEKKLLDELRRVMLMLESDPKEGVSRARNSVNEMVAGRMRFIDSDGSSMLFPMDIATDNSGTIYTTLRIHSQDTPAFLFALSNALSLRGISIEGVRIRTVGGIAEDEIDVLDRDGKKIVDQERLAQLKLSVLLTKQFAYFLGRASDPYAALSRFEFMLDDVLQLPERGQWLDLFSNPAALRGLAKVLGASDYLWEDFVRSQYEVFLPTLKTHLTGEGVSFSTGALNERLGAALSEADSSGARKEILNRFKDREIFLIDLGHILHSGVDVRALAEPLTRLAEVIVNRAVMIVYEDLVERHGIPQTVGGLEARFAVLGLGKLGGEALGYASDIELLFVFSDNGRTDSGESIGNAEFFNQLAEQTSKFIQSKREGVFRVDLRLRPYGQSGLKACSLESFCRYYASSGDSHSYERLALVRLRAIGGDKELGKRIERLRDEFIYASHSIDMAELQQLRERQLSAKGGRERLNAKFSQGALVDLEYYVQILQVMHGESAPELRTPRIHEALKALFGASVLDSNEGRQLVDAYYFLRRLINGLRMLRGNALDLFLPEEASPEYVHLARRMGYETSNDLGPERSLHLDFETYTAVVRTFIGRHFGREVLPDPNHGNIADLILSENPTEGLKMRTLGKLGFENNERAYVNFRKLAGAGERKDSFARLAVLACDDLVRMPDPDMALNSWERFARALPDAGAHYEMLLSQPRRLEILLKVFAGSQFLANTLARSPEFLDWTTDPVNLQGTRDRARMKSSLLEFIATERDDKPLLDSVRRFRRREVLRVGTRDICLRAPLEEITQDLSALAEVIIDFVLEKEWLRLAGEKHHPDIATLPDHFCVMALGKLGGRELNYSSDIDLLGIYDDASFGGSAGKQGELYALSMERLRNSLSAHTGEGYAYRVDLRLRPHGGAGELAQSLSSLGTYYEQKADTWEIQALLKARPVAGNRDVGCKFLGMLKPVLAKDRKRDDVVSSIRKMRGKAVQTSASDAERDIKTGVGGIRDVEFLVQCLQLCHLSTHPDLLEPNTLSAIALMREEGILSEAASTVLRDDYIFLRRIEHHLQILEDLQVHELPGSDAGLTALARRILGSGADKELLMREVSRRQQRIRGLYDEHLQSTTGP